MMVGYAVRTLRGNMADYRRCYRHRYRRRGVWQRRFWEHAIRDQRDFDVHCDYIHYNPGKTDCPFSLIYPCPLLTAGGIPSTPLRKNASNISTVQIGAL